MNEAEVVKNPTYFGGPSPLIPIAPDNKSVHSPVVKKCQKLRDALPASKWDPGIDQISGKDHKDGFHSVNQCFDRSEVCFRPEDIAECKYLHLYICCVAA